MGVAYSVKTTKRSMALKPNIVERYSMSAGTRRSLIMNTAVSEKRFFHREENRSVPPRINSAMGVVAAEY